MSPKLFERICRCGVEPITSGESTGHRLGGALRLGESSAGGSGLFPHSRKVMFSECFTELGQPVSDFGVVRHAIGLEIFFDQFLFQLPGFVVSIHFSLVLVRLTQSLPGLRELVTTGGVVRVIGENSLQRSYDCCGLFFIDGHVDLQEYGHPLVSVLCQGLRQPRLAFVEQDET